MRSGCPASTHMHRLHQTHICTRQNNLSLRTSAAVLRMLLDCSEDHMCSIRTVSELTLQWRGRKSPALRGGKGQGFRNLKFKHPCMTAELSLLKKLLRNRFRSLGVHTSASRSLQVNSAARQADCSL